MNKINIDRRRFLESALYSSLIYGAGSLPGVSSLAKANPAILNDKVLVDLFLDGGPDMRHLIVPAYSTQNGSFGQKYWANRQRSHNLAEHSQTAQQRWNNDYYHITVGNTGQNWTNGLVDIGNLNSGVTFGILKQAGWLIDMFRQGNVAFIFNAVGGTNRAHDLSSLMLQQGNLLSGLNDKQRSGWGGRLARSLNGNCIALTSTPSPFTFGPVGNSPNYNPNDIDNSDLVAVENSRQIGLFEAEFRDRQYSYWNSWKEKMARSTKSYYAALRQEDLPTVYDKALQHEENVRKFGKLMTSRLESVSIPERIQALYDNVSINGNPVNPDPATGYARKVLRSYSFGPQIRNLYDLLAVSDLESHAASMFPGEFPGFSFQPRVLSMEYGGWDTHSQQRPYNEDLAGDPNNPYINRGIENGIRDIFGGRFGNNAATPSALHGGLSALWDSLGTNSRQNIAMVIAGEFGRQIRDNGDYGTDHGQGNLMMVISEQCNGGIYGDMFPDSELVKYDEPVDRTPDITPLTEIDHIFSRVCDWMETGLGATVFPRSSSSYSGTSPILERTNMFNGLFS